MAKLTTEELTKHSYKKTLISKIRDGIPLELDKKDKSGNLEIAVVTADNKFLKSLEKANTIDELTALLKDGKSYARVFKVKTNKIGLSEISKESVKDHKSRVGDAKTTQMQELCSLKIFENLLQNNRKTEFSELVKIYPGLVTDKSWQVSFEAQFDAFRRIKSKYSLGKMKEYNRDGGFMDYITKKVKTFGISQKDAWNPADIWLVKDAKVQRDIEKNCETLYKLNTYMIQLFNEGRLVGVSLKKTKKSASFEETNISKAKSTSLDFISGNITVSLKNNKFMNDELNYDQKYNDKSVINVQVRMYPKKSKSNVQVSYKLKGGAAEFGKVPAAFRNASLESFGGKYPAGKNMPASLQDFVNEEREWARKIDKIIRAKRFKTDVTNSDVFIKNVKAAYKNNDEQYHMIEMCSKFQGIELAYHLSNIKQAELNELLTRWAYLSQKKGQEFGPFIKVS